MIITHTYLTKSPKRGTYGYRREIPKHLRYLFDGRREHKISFKTKNLKAALSKLDETNRWFAERENTHHLSQRHYSDLPPNERLKAAHDILKAIGLHPPNAPRLTPFSTPEERASYDQEEYEWKEMRAELIDGVTDKLVDEEQRQRDYDSGRWFKPEYQTPYKAPDSNDVEILAIRIAKGEINVSPDPTWRDALRFYLHINARSKVRNDVQQAKHEKASIRLFERLGAELPEGMNTLLQNLDRLVIRAAVERLWPNASTRSKNVGIFQSAIATWNRENSAQAVANEFAGLVDGSLVKKASKDRRPFTPSEYKRFMTNLVSNEDTELSLLGLIVAYTGGRNGEIAGLSMKDVKTDSKYPHLIIRNNKNRILGKDSFDRTVPIPSKLLAHLVDYLAEQTLTEERLFPKWGDPKKATDLSKALSKLVVNLRLDDDRLLTPYSLRHTFKDRYLAAGVRQDVGMYLMGHKSVESSRVHDSYGTKPPPQKHAEYLEQISNVEEWGYFE